MNVHIKSRVIKSKAIQGFIILLAFIVTIPLLFIIYYIIREGITKINWTFLTHRPTPVGVTGGGIGNALLGSILIVIVSSIIAIPIGILGGIYLSENKKGRLSYWSRLAVDVLQGVPSIVIGVVVYFWVVKPLGFSALSGSIALAIMMLPIIIRSTEETLKLIPDTLKEAGFALGMPYHRVILKILVPCGMSGILSGVLLSIARVAGETAPLIFTAFGNAYFSLNIAQPIESIPHVIYKYAISPYNDWHDLAWGAAFILLITVLLLNIITKLITKRWNVQL